jgi:hypothetical protein
VQGRELLKDEDLTGYIRLFQSSYSLQGILWITILLELERYPDCLNLLTKDGVTATLMFFVSPIMEESIHTIKAPKEAYVAFDGKGFEVVYTMARRKFPTSKNGPARCSNLSLLRKTRESFR